MDHPTATASTGIDRRCQAHSKATGERCGKWAMVGLTVCRAHGGAAHRNLGRRRAEAADMEQRAGRFLIRCGLEPQDGRSPLDELAWQLRRQALQVRGLEALIAEEDSPLVDLDERGASAVSGWMQLLLRTRDQWRQFMETAAKVGVASHLVAQDQADRDAIARDVAEVVRGAVTDAELDDDQAHRVLVAAARRLRALAGQRAAG